MPRHSRLALFALLVLLLAGPAAASKPVPDDAPQAASDVWYEIFVRSWADTNGDGIGDLNGVTAKLDYLQSLGVSGIWLMPINPSPSYHGYDVTDYRGINPEYGTLADFDRLLAEAHKRGIKIIMDLVINHSSSDHPWFKAARDPASKYHDWYQWSNPHTDLDAISATGSPAWHALGKQHYLGIFVAEMPDLNFDNPAVRKEMIDIGQFWLKRGVDGFRLDAAQHVYYDFENQRHDAKILAKNLAWWDEFRRGVDRVDPNAWLVGEVTRDSEAELAPWFKPLSAVFNFPLATQLIESARSSQAGALPALIDATTRAWHAVTGKYGVDVPFLSNHDQERVMSQLHDQPGAMRIAAAMLLTLPGEPFIYYGEELGMRGQKPDPDLREPMRWYRDPQGTDQTHWKEFTAGDGPNITVQAQQHDAHSLLAHYRQLIGWRRQISALRDGELTTRDLGNPQLVAWELRDANGQVLVVHNLSGKAQTIKLGAHDLQRYTRLKEHTVATTTLADGVLQLPAFGSAILLPATTTKR